MRVVFFGTPDFAVPPLEALAAAEDLRPVRVITQPSRPVGRRRALKAPPVAVRAGELGLPVQQAPSVRDPAFLGDLEALEPDVAVVVAFGQIFRRRLLGLPRLGCVNLHASLLPAFRGAAPIQASIAAGDRETGVTTMRMTRGLDSGPMLLRASLAIGPDETAPELSARLSELGAGLLVRTLRGLERGQIEAQPQDESAVSFAPMLSREDALVDWNLPAEALYNRWRGFNPWPGLTSHFAGRPLKLTSVRPLAGSTQEPPGALLGLSGDAVTVACGSGTILAAERVQRPGKKPVSGADFLNSERPEPGERFGPLEAPD